MPWRKAALVLASSTAFALLLSISSRGAEGLDAEARAAIVRLIEVGWPATPSARQAAEEQITVVQRLAGTDPRALEAAWLVLLQQRRYDEALKRLDEHLAAVPDDPQALQAKAWTQAVVKQYPAAMVTLEKLRGCVETWAPADDAGKANRTDAITFLGRMLGYLGGPVSDAVSQDERKALERRVVTRLDPTERVLFDAARDGVLQKFLEVTESSAIERERVAAELAAEKEKTLEELAAERKEIETRSRDLQDRRSKLQAELRDELAEIQKEDQPLVEELARLEARANVISTDLATYVVEAQRLRQMAAKEQNMALRTQLLADADRLSFAASRLEADLIAARRLGRGVQAQRGALAGRQARARANAASQVKRIDSELADLVKRQRQSELIERRTSRQPSAPTSRGRALSATASALSTYEQLPLEAAKLRLLESLR